MKRVLSVFLIGVLLLGGSSGVWGQGLQSGRNISFEEPHSFLDPYIRVMAADEDYIWATQERDMSYLCRSDDFGDTWQRVYRFDKRIETIHITPDNVILVSISDGRWLEEANSQIMRSGDGGYSFSPVLELGDGAAYHWNISSDDEGYVFVSEYGYKAYPNNSRKIYRSKDGGLNWKTVYDPAPKEGIHNHVISIDKNDNNIIYQVVGDNQKDILKSVDRGDSWESILQGYHPTSVIQIDDTMFWGLDGVPKSGVISYDTTTKKLGYSLETPKPLDGSAYDMLYVNDVMYVGFLSYSDLHQDWDGSIFASEDQGKTWRQFATFPKYEGFGIGLEKFTAFEDYGFIYGSFPVWSDGKVSSYSGTIRFDLLNVSEKVDCTPRLGEGLGPEGEA